VNTSAPPRTLGRVLVVEDERDVAELIRYNLGKEGYDVLVTGSGTDAVKQAREARPDIVLLDIMVPHLNGWEVCRRLKQDAPTRAIPVIMVTGRTEEGDKVLGFEMGADDYVTKPFSPRELVARVRAVVRRGRGDTTDRKSHVRVGDLEIDRHRFEVRLEGRGVELTPKEFELLAILAGPPAGCSAARSCSTPSGAATVSSSRGPSTCTWPGCGPSSPAPGCPRQASRPCAGSGTGSATRSGRNTDVTRAL